eukprot:jgi/Botrbrau1/22120/Bobra.0206s0044.1
MAFGPTITKQAQGEHTSTVIFLHGYGESGIKWSKLAAALNLPNVKFVFPTAPLRRVTALGSNTTAWFDFAGYDDVEQGRTDIDGIPNSLEFLEELVKAEIKSGTPAKAISIGGFSNGGHVALQYFLSRDVVPVGGIFCICSVISDILCTELTEAQKCTKVFWALGGEDPLVPKDLAYTAVRTLREEGISSLEFSEYEGAGHEPAQDMMEDLRDWLLTVPQRGDCM